MPQSQPKPETETPGFGYAPSSLTDTPKTVSVEAWSGASPDVSTQQV
jgi:hypothetical protein